MPIEAIIWDIGGVLARTIDRQPRTSLASQFGLTYEALEKLVFGGENGRLTQLGEITTRQHLAWVCGQLGLPASQGAEFMAAFFGGDRLDEELVAYIRRLHTHYKTGIISNGFDDVRCTIHDKWRIADAFDHIVISGEAGLMKPDPRIYLLAVSGLKVEPEAVVFIDDVARNVSGAQAVGMQGIQFLNPAQVMSDLNRMLCLPA